MFTIQEMRKLANADPANLPKLIVHANSLWGGDAKVGRENDGTLQVHMNFAAYLRLKRELPLERVRQLAQHTFEARIALERHHLLGGVNDSERPAADARERRGNLREMLGFDRDTAAPKSEVAAPIAAAGRMVRGA